VTREAIDREARDGSRQDERGIGHPKGRSSKPRALGVCSYTACWMRHTNSRKAHDAAETMMPSPAAMASSVRYSWCG
jgi:hypothetical protein